MKSSGAIVTTIERQTASVEKFCLLCGAPLKNGEFFPGSHPWQYMRCPTCQMVSMNPIPDEDVLRAYYNHAYMVPLHAYSKGTQQKAGLILEQLRKHRGGSGKILEIGCSYGFFLDAARREEWDPTGIELDDGAAAYGREKLGLKIFCGTLESQLGRLEPPYDAIVTFHVIEHVRDPLGFLQLCRKLLRDNGVLILKTPNVASWIAKTTGPYWQWFHPPAHIHLFSPRTLVLALEKSGFQSEKVWSQRGDAHNNLFELACAAGRYASKKKGAVEGSNGRKSWVDRWHVNAARAASDAMYYPLSLLLDPWLGKKGLQPELVAIARA